MSDHDSFEDRLRAIADKISRSVQRISDLDMDELSQRYGVDADRARAFADAAGQWLNDRFSGGDPLFGQTKRSAADSADRPFGVDVDLDATSDTGREQPVSGAGPHPLDLPTEQQGIA